MTDAWQHRILVAGFFYERLRYIEKWFTYHISFVNLTVQIEHVGVDLQILDKPGLGRVQEIPGAL